MNNQKRVQKTRVDGVKQHYNVGRSATTNADARFEALTEAVADIPDVEVDAVALRNAMDQNGSVAGREITDVTVDGNKVRVTAHGTRTEGIDLQSVGGGDIMAGEVAGRAFARGDREVSASDVDTVLETERQHWVEERKFSEGEDKGLADIESDVRDAIDDAGFDSSEIELDVDYTETVDVAWETNAESSLTEDAQVMLDELWD